MTKGFIARLLDGRDSTADSMILVTLIAIGGLVAITAYDVVRNKAHLDPLSFGTGCASILAGLGGGKALRGWGQSQSNPQVPQDPPEGLIAAAKSE